MTSFRYKCFQNLLETFGAVDAIVECIELSVRELLRQAEKHDDFDAYISKKASINNINVNTVCAKSLKSRACQLHILNVHQQFELYLDNFKKENPQISALPDNNKESTLKRTLKAVGNDSGLISQLEIDIMEYYKNIRNVFMHPEINKNKHDSSAYTIKNKLKSDKNLKKYSAPNPYVSLEFDDFILFTKVAKDIAEKLCILGVPSIENIAAMVQLSIHFKKLRKFKNNQKRLENSLATLCRCEYSISRTDAEEIVPKLAEALA